MNQRFLCFHCHQPFEDEQEFCSHCGSTLYSEEGPTLAGKQEHPWKGKGDVTYLPCPRCGELVVEGSSYCNICGEALTLESKKKRAQAHVGALRRRASVIEMAHKIQKSSAPPFLVPFPMSFISFVQRCVRTPKRYIWISIWIGVLLPLIAALTIPTFLGPERSRLDSVIMWSQAAGGLFYMAHIIAGVFVTFGLYVSYIWSVNFDEGRGSEMHEVLLLLYIGANIFVVPLFLLGDLLPQSTPWPASFPGVLSFVANGTLAFLLFLAKVTHFVQRKFSR